MGEVTQTDGSVNSIVHFSLGIAYEVKCGVAVEGDIIHLGGFFTVAPLKCG